MARLEVNLCCFFVHRLKLQRQEGKYFSTLGQGVSV